MNHIEGVLGLMIPIIALMIPVVAILVAHQQKMAQIINQGQPQLPVQELEGVRRDILELKQLVHQQSIAIDTIAQRSIAKDDLVRRIEAGS